MFFLTTILFALFGACIGRLMAVATYFLPQMLLAEGTEEDASLLILKRYLQKPFCWRCKHVLTSRSQESYFINFFGRSTCSHCKRYNVSQETLWLEIGMSLLFATSQIVFPSGPSLLFVLGASCLLICCFITDYQHHILPDQFTLALVWLGMIGSLQPIFVSPRESIIGAVSGYGIFWVMNAIYRYVRGSDGMFPGDFKLIAGIGACIGFEHLIPLLALSFISLISITLARALYKKKTTHISSFYKEYLAKEVPYGCFSSVIALGFLYYLLAEKV